MHQDKKREELEQKREFEQIQQEEMIKQTEVEGIEIEQENSTPLIEEKDIFKEIENEIQRSKKKRREMVFEFALFLILGVLLGVTMKTEAVKKITIGFNDYQIESGKERYDIAGIKTRLEQEATEQQEEIEQSSEAQQVETIQE